MAEYLTPAGLQAVASYESGTPGIAGTANPTAVNGNATGAYQFLGSTWSQYAPQAGVSLSQYPTAASAPIEVQSAVASVTPVSNWTCEGCDAGFTTALASNPQWVSAVPTGTDPNISYSVTTSGSDTTSGSGSDTPTGVATSGPTSVGAPIASTAGNIAGYVANAATAVPTAITNAADAVGNSISAGISNTLSAAENWLERSLIVILGIVLIGLGFWAIAGRKATTVIAETAASGVE